MRFVRIKEEKIQFFIGVVCIILLAIAYISYLGYLPLSTITDEPRRALISAEMMISGDYITPTINGELYLNKPPLYNWIIIAYFKMFGDYSMFAFRLPVIVATFGMSLTVYYFTKKFTNSYIAFFTAFAYATNGRILIYDSLQGLIDTSFAWLVYLNFMLVYSLGEKKKYTQLFIVTYIITAAAFMMKGLPALIFQGFTLLTYFILKRKFSILFRPVHFIAVALLFSILGGYYYIYFNRNNLEATVLFSNLFNESTKRTGIVFGFWQTILHLFTFPFEMLYHYAPWTIFVIVLFTKNVWSLIKQHAFIEYSFWVFLSNFIIYWSSPEVYARYLFMFLPLIYSIFFYVYDCVKKQSTWQVKTINTIIVSVCVIVTFSFLFFPFTSITNKIDNVYLKSILLFLAFAIISYYMIKIKLYRLHLFVAAVIVSRIAFNLFVIPQRGKIPLIAENLGEKIVAITKGSELYILKNAHVGTPDALSFHISTKRNEVLKFSSKIKPEAFYIADKEQLKNMHYIEYLRFATYMSDSLELVKFSNDMKVNSKMKSK